MSADPLIGTTLAGRYRLDGVLGAGGMGAVYLATQLDLARSVAIKLMHAVPGARGAEARARFAREARVTAALHHPNAVKIFDFGEDEEERLYLVMERLRGTTLRTFVHEDLPPLGLARTVDVGMQIADVLVAAHAIGLVHRDLKPENIFLEAHHDGSDRVVVVDFGLAYIEDRADASRMTQEGMIAGTPFYMSPEQCTASAIGTPSDVYSLGCMLYEMATAHVPFDGASFALLTKHVYEEAVRPAQRRADVYVPRALDQLIVDMLAKRPEARPSAEAVVHELARVALTLGERERARGRELLEGRAARMIPTVREPATLAEERARPTLDVRRIALVGALAPEVETGLRVNGFTATAVHGSPLPPDAVAIFAPGADEALLGQLVGFGLPVLTDASSDEVDRVARLVGLGVADVLTRPVRAEALASKLQRALKKHARRGGR